MSFNFGQHQRGGPLYVKDHGPYFGDIMADGNGTFGGDLSCVNLAVSGNITIASTSVVDVLTAQVYNFSDPRLELNSTFSGNQVLQAGLTIARKPGFEDAVLFYEDPDTLGNPGRWYAGMQSTFTTNALLTGDVTGYANGEILFWGLVAGKAITTTAIVINTASSTFSMSWPIDARYTNGAYYSAITNTSYRDDLLTVGHRTGGGVIDASHKLGWLPAVTIRESVETNVTTHTGTGIMHFSSTNTADGAVQFSFGDIFAATREAGSKPTIWGQGTELTITGPDNLYLNGTTGVFVSGGGATFNCDINASGQTITAGTLSTDNFTADKYTFSKPTGFNPIPIVGGWTGDITIGAVTYNVSDELRQNTQSYVLRVTWDNVTTTVIPNNTTYTFEIPLNINADLGRSRSFSGVMLRRAAIPPSPVAYAYPLTPGSLYIGPSKQIDPVYLTTANMVGYNVIYLTITGTPGYFEAVIVIEFDAT